MILVVTLLVLLAIATTGISVYVAIVGNTLPLSVDGIELVVYLVTLVCCFIQFHEGRQLSRLLNEYKRVIGIKISKIRVTFKANPVQSRIYRRVPPSTRTLWGRNRTAAFRVYQWIDSYELLE